MKRINIAGAKAPLGDLIAAGHGATIVTLDRRLADKALALGQNTSLL